MDVGHIVMGVAMVIVLVAVAAWVFMFTDKRTGHDDNDRQGRWEAGHGDGSAGDSRGCGGGGCGGGN